MDAFDTRMSTFGGKSADKGNKKKNFDKFIAEKRGFLRTTNQFYNNDTQKIAKFEKPKIVQKPGPALNVSYDNKYKQNTSFATDQGRFKQELKVNQADEKKLKSANKTEMMEALKYSNIRFDFDEKGAEEFQREDQEVDQQRVSARGNEMQTINEAQESRDELTRDNEENVLNGGKKSLVAPRRTDYWSGQVYRSHSN